MTRKTLTTIIYLSILTTPVSQTKAQEFLEGMNCSRLSEGIPVGREIPIGLEVATPITDVTVSLRLPRDVLHFCELTFSTEAATTRSSPQQMALFYDIQVFPRDLEPRRLIFEGPRLSEVDSALPEVHTFENLMSITQVEGQDRFEITPVLGRTRLTENRFSIFDHCFRVECTAEARFGL